MTKAEASKIRYSTQNKDRLLDVTDPQAAYYIGLLFADGYVDYRGRSVSIALRDYDAHILYDFARFLGLPETAVRVVSRSRQNQRVLTINSASVVRKLYAYGIVPRKSTHGVPFFPQDNPDALMAFIHGWLDGDGHIKKQCMFSMSTEVQASVLCAYLRVLGGVGTIGHVGKYYRVVLNKRDNMQFLSRLFNQPICCIERKSRAFVEFYCRKING